MFLSFQIEVNLSQAKKKNSAVANKVQLMRIKSKATGLKTIPITDRLYLNIEHRGRGIVKVSPIFVSRNWSLGRSIDGIANELKIENNNNRNDKFKLRLFKKDDGKLLSRELSVTLEVLLKENIICDGENLILEYVESSCAQLSIE